MSNNKIFYKQGLKIIIWKTNDSTILQVYHPNTLKFYFDLKINK